jgi:succinate dehydrogenase/fumarate reductase flavoprotein subunit
MPQETIRIAGLELPFHRLNTLVVGTGAAGLNAADTLHALGQNDIALLSEGLSMGTSRNTGSDKQTYYKLTLAGGEPDSVLEMARTLFAGGSMHGDIALVEAALSAPCFAKLVSIGVPFPHDRYGQYVGYKTDHDPRQRATSCGPYTSRYMVEHLERQVFAKGIRLFDGFRAIALLTAPEGAGRRIVGLLALDKSQTGSPTLGLVAFSCSAIVWATGGPGGIYRASVYPESQTCATGAPLEAGAAAVNLTESQYGIASTKFRWNLSGTYQQVLPRYVSTDAEGGDEREFLDAGFADGRAMLRAEFLKGYQWPFDAGKAGPGGSSTVDLLVYEETVVKGRRVFMDFRRNPTAACRAGAFDPDTLDDEARGYLSRSQALQETPYDRLVAMNPGAAELYREHGIDLASEPLEIAVCAQHNNGGLQGDLWWESDLKRLFPVGEVNGTFGARRPGGSALNSTQVGSRRAAQAIHARYADAPFEADALLAAAGEQLAKTVELALRLAGRQEPAEPAGAGGSAEASGTGDVRGRGMDRMSQAGGHIRSLPAVRSALAETREELRRFAATRRAKDPADLVEAFIDRDVLLTQFAYLSAIEAYIARGGPSRGGYLVQGAAPSEWQPDAEVGGTHLRVADDGTPSCEHDWTPVRPIPQEDDWFENVWRAYREGGVWL